SGDYALVVNRIDGLTESFSYALAWNTVAASLEPPVLFADWQKLFFSEDELNDPEISTPTADPDGDAIPNLLEYALGGDPRQADRNILPVEGTAFEEGADHLILKFIRPAGLEDITYRVDTSGGLTSWSEGAGILLASTENEDGTVTESYRD